jgi:hypothetical protein
VCVCVCALMFAVSECVRVLMRACLQIGQAGRDSKESAIAMAFISPKPSGPRISPKVYKPTASDDDVRKAAADVYQLHHLFCFLFGDRCHRKALAEFMGDPIPDALRAGMKCCDVCDYRASPDFKEEDIGWELSAVLTAIRAGCGTFTVRDVIAVLRGQQPKRMAVDVPTSKFSCPSFGCFSDSGPQPRTADYLFQLIYGIAGVGLQFVSEPSLEKERLGGLMLKDVGLAWLTAHSFTAKMDDFKGVFKLGLNFARRKDGVKVTRKRGPRQDKQRPKLLRAWMVPEINRMAEVLDQVPGYVFPDASFETLSTLTADLLDLPEAELLSRFPLLRGIAFDAVSAAQRWPAFLTKLIEVASMTNEQLKKKVGKGDLPVAAPTKRATEVKADTESKLEASGKDEKKDTAAPKQKSKHRRKRNTGDAGDPTYHRRGESLSVPPTQISDRRVHGVLRGVNSPAHPRHDISQSRVLSPGERQLRAANPRASALRSRLVNRFAAEIESLESDSDNESKR